jgi:hypothetical protein
MKCKRTSKFENNATEMSGELVRYIYSGESPIQRWSRICCVVSIERPVHELDTISIDWTSTSHSKIIGWTYVIDRLY